jgi:hypothetical protein
MRSICHYTRRVEVGETPEQCAADLVKLLDRLGLKPIRPEVPMDAAEAYCIGDIMVVRYFSSLDYEFVTYVSCGANEEV